MKTNSKRSRLLVTLFLSMLKIGLFAFGGGYTMIALLENEFVTKRGWLDKEEFLDLAAIAESTPGPIAINSATYIGYKIAGFFGSLSATVAVCIPSFTIIYVISLVFDTFLSFQYVAYAFRGIQVCVIYLIACAGIKMFRELKRSFLNIFLLSATLVLMVTLSVFAVSFSSVFYILSGGTVGIFVYLLSKIRKRRKAQK